jgi:tripartite-type tricarboxylate transporter receptor subunit TctC
MTYVPYSGNLPAVNALLGNHVTAAIADYADAAPQLKAKNLRSLAVASGSRIESLPHIPTIGESGYKDYEVEGSLGVVAPANTPKETVGRLIEWFTAALDAPTVARSLENFGLFAVHNCGTDFGAYLRRRYDEYGRTIREANIRTR